MMSELKPQDGPLAALAAVADESATGLVPRSYRGLSPTEREDERRTRLLEAALEVFGREGLEGISLRQLAARARLQDKHARELFESADAVFTAVHRQLSAEVSRLMNARFFAADGLNQFEPAFRQALLAYFQYIQEDQRRARILVIDGFRRGLLDPTNMEAYVSRYSDVLRYRVKQRFPGLNAPLDPQVALAGLAGLIVSSTRAWVLRGFDLPPDLVVEHCMFGFTGMVAWLEAEQRKQT
jgi:AcrR family transcriptional regulator